MIIRTHNQIINGIAKDKWKHTDKWVLVKSIKDDLKE